MVDDRVGDGAAAWQADNNIVTNRRAGNNVFLMG
jgi:hypothetical protein